MNSFRQIFIFILFTAVLQHSLSHASNREGENTIVVFEDSSESYKKFAKEHEGEGLNLAIQTGLYSFAQEEKEEAAILTLYNLIKVKGKKGFLEELAQKESGFAASLLGSHLSMFEPTLESVKWFEIAEDKGCYKDSNFRYNYALALVCFHDKQERKTSHEALAKAWNLLKQWSEFGSADNNNKKQYLTKAYKFLGEKILLTEDEPLLTEMHAWFKSQPGNDESTDAFISAFYSQFLGTDLWDKIFDPCILQFMN